MMNLYFMRGTYCGSGRLNNEFILVSVAGIVRFLMSKKHPVGELPLCKICGNRHASRNPHIWGKRKKKKVIK